MENQYEFVLRDGEYYILTEDTKTINLKEAISGLAMSTYATLLGFSKEKDADERKRLEEKISFQSRLLDSLSNAYSAINHR